MKNQKHVALHHGERMKKITEEISEDDISII